MSLWVPYAGDVTFIETELSTCRHVWPCLPERFHSCCPVLEGVDPKKKKKGQAAKEKEKHWRHLQTPNLLSLGAKTWKPERSGKKQLIRNKRCINKVCLFVTTTTRSRSERLKHFPNRLPERESGGREESAAGNGKLIHPHSEKFRFTQIFIKT